MKVTLRIVGSHDVATVELDAVPSKGAFVELGDDLSRRVIQTLWHVTELPPRVVVVVE